MGAGLQQWTSPTNKAVGNREMAVAHTEFTTEELQRYDRQILMPQVGRTGQQRLKKSMVAIAGAGGLGSPIAMYLAAAGVGHLRLIDCDTVETGNLNRQLLHWQEDVGRPKTESALAKLTRINPDIDIEVRCTRIDAHNATGILAGCDAVVDALDNLATRYIVNRAVITGGLPFFHGAVNGFEGRAMSILPGKSACLRCLYKGPVPEEVTPVIGVTPGIIGTIQATEVIKYLLGEGKLLTNRMLHYDGLAMVFHEFHVRRNPKCDHCGDLFRK
ncbi:MAG: HesA/MoeB/ThiF family protein [Desulfosarcinaceae bacterium]